MPYQIDQSVKVEQTSRDTVLCLSNEQWAAVMIEARTKRQLQEIFRRHGQPRNFVIFTFCAGIALLLELLPVHTVMIDREYPDKDALIKGILIAMMRNGPRMPEIYFGLIGKRAKAHFRAIRITRGKREGSVTVGMREVLAQIKKTEVGNRLKGA